MSKLDNVDCKKRVLWKHGALFFVPLSSQERGLRFCAVEMEDTKKIQEQLADLFPPEKLKNWIRKCERENAMWKFYKSRWFRCIRAAVLEEQYNECQRCKAKGQITKADTVHHEKHVRDYPELALSAYYVDRDGVERRNLVAICKACHALEHPEKIKKINEGYTNKERW